MFSSKILVVTTIALVTFSIQNAALAYPPAVGILGKAQNCMTCHLSNGLWQDNENLIIDILEKDTKLSLRQPDGSFTVEARRGEPITLLTVIGYRGNDQDLIPYRNAWLYVDSETIAGSALSKFSPGWDVNLPMACRIVGDRIDAYPDAHLTVLPFTIRPTDAARDGVLTLQIMLTKGESVKGKPREGIVGSYFERAVYLKVKD